MAVRPFAISVAFLLCAAGCSLGMPGSGAPPAIGDSCVVGRWILTQETNTSGYAYAGTPVAVSGLAGAQLTLTSAGDEKVNFDGSEPLVGTLASGLRLSITLGGSFDYKIHTASGQYQETGAVVQVPTTATAGGAPVTDYHSSNSPGSGTYTCSSGGLTMTTKGGNQTDSWSKA
jgi:hypothetical protein